MEFLFGCLGVPSSSLSSELAYRSYLLRFRLPLTDDNDLVEQEVRSTTLSVDEADVCVCPAPLEDHSFISWKMMIPSLSVAQSEGSCIDTLSCMASSRLEKSQSSSHSDLLLTQLPIGESESSVDESDEQGEEGE